MSLCHCMGPQNGEPACPCDMKNLKQVDGRWVKVIDYGPVEERNKNLNKPFSIDNFGVSSENDIYGKETDDD